MVLPFLDVFYGDVFGCFRDALTIHFCLYKGEQGTIRLFFHPWGFGRVRFDVNAMRVTQGTRCTDLTTGQKDACYQAPARVYRHQVDLTTCFCMQDMGSILQLRGSIKRGLVCYEGTRGITTSISNGRNRIMKGQSTRRFHHHLRVATSCHLSCTH